MNLPGEDRPFSWLRVNSRGTVWRYLRERGDQKACFYCGFVPGMSGPRLQFDHVTPLSRGGADELDNVVYACEPCNTAKSTWPGWLFVFRHTGILERIRDERLRSLRAALERETA